MMVDMNMGDRLRALRTAKNLTMQELADLVNVSKSNISRFENGRSIPDIEMLDSTLQALGTD